MWLNFKKNKTFLVIIKPNVIAICPANHHSGLEETRQLYGQGFLPAAEFGISQYKKVEKTSK
jgi:hypothetical protein